MPECVRKFPRNLKSKMEAENEAEKCSSADSPSVLPIDRKTVHQICSGQVVLNLATAIKELLENSLDAGATSVDIRLKENGAELIEVSDNGCGVEPQNFEALTLKHHTSKIRDFNDLSSVETFGFRGEALSSLCALSNMAITTKHKSQVAGTKLVYDHNGKLQSQTACARQQGTTVTLCNLFSTLPVRHKEFMHNIKKELVKLVQVLQGYCIISNSIRILCTNQVDKGRKTTIMSTLGSDQIKDNISCIFGPKQVQTLIPFTQVKPAEEECNEYNIKTTSNESSLFKISGYISKPDHGLGRSSADRQFYFINKRPCDLLKVSRVVNEVYHMYNRHQYPFVMLDISLQRDTVDVNVTPDKRKVFMQEEKMLLATIKTSLKTMFDPGTSSYEINQKPLSQLSFKVNTNKDKETAVKDKETGDFPWKVFPSLSRFKRTFTEMSGKTRSKKEPKAKQVKLTTFCDNVRDFGNKIFGRNTASLTDSSANNNAGNQETVGNCDEETVYALTASDRVSCTNKLSTTVDECEISPVFLHTEMEDEVEEKEKRKGEEEGNNIDVIEYQSNEVQLINDDNSYVKEKMLGQRTDVNKNEKVEKLNPYCEEIVIIDQQSINNANTNTKHQDKVIKKMKSNFHGSLEQRKVTPVEFKMNQLQEHVKRVECIEKQESVARSFRAKIAPENNTAAEEELTKNINKDSFNNMEILGQFNLGFILTKLEDDIFIIDQHASDEKYNFENQQKHTTLQTQRLIIPKQLELTPVNECILIDNIEIFRKNGFDFEVNEDAQTMRKVKLVSVPVSKNWTFGVEDVEELIFMLSDSPGVMCRPSRVRNMFASRACRMSTMVGKALSRDEMRKIVKHMGEMDHPWNCPHGRPTMRHVINLIMIAAGEKNH